MAQTLDQVLAELSKVYDPQANAINQQIGELPSYYQGQRQGLETAKTNAFTNINNDAARRGIGYGGMPIHEQTKYLGERFLPGMQDLATDERQQRFKLTGALNDLNMRRQDQAYGIRQKQVDTETAAQLEREKMRAAERASRVSAAFNPYGNQKQPAPQNNPAESGDPVKYAYDIVMRVAQDHDKIPELGGRFTWGGVANYLKSQGMPVTRGSAADKALNLYFNKNNYDGYVQSLRAQGLA